MQLAFKKTQFTGCQSFYKDECSRKPLPASSLQITSVPQEKHKKFTEIGQDAELSNKKKTGQNTRSEERGHVENGLSSRQFPKEQVIVEPCIELNLDYH